MRLTSRAIYFAFILTLVSSTSSYAERHVSHDRNTQSEIETLSSGLRVLLSKEMLALQDGMMSIIPAYAAGDWQAIEAIAYKMKNSYILKQSLSDKQKHELHSTLPEAFITLDQQFHYLAGMLEHVAAKQKKELVGFYFSELSNACISCHASYATHTFPALDSKNDHSHSH